MYSLLKNQCKNARPLAYTDIQAATVTHYQQHVLVVAYIGEALWLDQQLTFHNHTDKECYGHL